MSARIFIRNDDVWTLDREFRFFFDLAMDHGLPVIHAVIPGKMDQGLIRFLCRAKEKTPQLLEIVQHGWMHANYSVEPGTKYEFGVSREYGVQREDIKQGLNKMRLAFGEYFTPAFVPPYHGYDESTLRVLQQEGFQIFSAGTRQMAEKGQFLNLPAGVSFSCYGQDGAKSIYNAADMIRMLAAGIHRQPFSGILTHHEDFKTAVSCKELERFFDFITVLRNKKEWQVLLFSNILGELTNEYQHNRSKDA